MKNALTFLRKIKKNNNTPWMHAHKDEYLAAKAEFEFLAQELIVRLSHWESRFEHLEPKNVMFRFNRDIRFSNNKNPYKENFAAYFGIGGKKSDLPGYYLHVSPKEVFVAAGLWHPEADTLARVRRYISENGDELVKIVENKKFKTAFGVLSDEEGLKRVPKGFDPEDEFGELLKMKNFVVRKSLAVADVTEKGFGVKVDKILKELKPFVKFLEDAGREKRVTESVVGNGLFHNAEKTLMNFLILFILSFPLFASPVKKSVKTFQWKNPQTPVEIVTIDKNGDGKTDRVEKYYEDRKLNHRIRRVEQNGKVFVTFTKLIQEVTCDANEQPEVTELDQQVAAATTVIDSYTTLEPNHRVHKSCFDRWGRDNFTAGVRQATIDKMACMDRLASAPTTYANHATEIARDLRALWARSPVTIQCNENRNWTVSSAFSLAFASSGPDSRMEAIPEVQHPYMSLNPETPEVAGAPDEFELKNLPSMIFHEGIHNVGHSHGEGIEHTYGCQSCCAPETNPQARAMACRVCIGDYADGANDRGYVHDMLFWSFSQDMSFRPELAEAAVVNFIYETGEERYGLISLATGTSNQLDGVGIEIMEEFKNRYSEDQRTEEERRLIGIVNPQNPIFFAVVPFRTDAQTIASAYVNYYVDSNPTQALRVIGQNKERLRTLLTTPRAGLDVPVVNAMKGHLSRVLESIRMINYPNEDANPHLAVAKQLEIDLGLVESGN